MNDTYFLRIKKDYAASVINDLEKMDAVELIDETNFSIPQWQIDKVNAARKNIETNPDSLIDWDAVKKSVKNKL